MKAPSTLLVAALAAVSFTDAAHVDPALHRALRQQNGVNIMVTMKQGTQSVLESHVESSFNSRGDLISSIVDSLESHASESQRSVVNLLKTESDTPSEFKSFWISNQLWIKDASSDLVQRLSQLPDVASIAQEQVLPLEPIRETMHLDVVNNTILANEWGVSKINAPQLWSKGINGKGIVVSSIDTGVRYTHVALKKNFRGNYGWYDPGSKKSTPYDDVGHGTHTMGTIAGANGIGVAPGATWMSCKGCSPDGCSESDLTGCAQFILCPTDTQGNNKDCTKAPHLVSNSWGGGQGDSFYQASVDAWRKAGIIPIFSQGNAGPECGTANSPGDYPTVIGVGSTNSGDGLSDYSSKGPSVTGLLKPDISAPGENVRSAWYTGDNAYNTISGTSMACPHVAGATALVLQSKPNYKFDDIKQVFTSKADTSTLQDTGYTCGDTSDGSFPNNQYGYGRLNVLASLS